MNPIKKLALFFTSLTVLGAGFPVAAASAPEPPEPSVKMQAVISLWGTDLRQENFMELRQHLQSWTTRDFAFNSQIGLRALDRLIASEKQDLALARKAQRDFEKQYNVKLHLSVYFHPDVMVGSARTATQDAVLAYRVPASGKKKMPNGMVQGEAGDIGHSQTYHLTWTRTPLGWKIRSLKIHPNPMIGTALFIEPAKQSGGH